MDEVDDVSDEVNALIQKAHKRLEAAKELFRLKYYEDCINRAYYAMVSAATAALKLKDVTPRTHKGLHAKFSEIFVKSGEIEAKLRRKFHYAEDLRNKADYDSFETVSDEQAEIVLADAEEFIDSIEKLIGS